MQSSKNNDFLSLGLQQGNGMQGLDSSNSFLSSLPKLHMDDLNTFEGFAKNVTNIQEVSPANESSLALENQKMMDSITAAFGNPTTNDSMAFGNTNTNMMLPMTPESFAMNPFNAPQSQQNGFPPQNQQQLNQWTKRRPSFMAESVGSHSSEFDLSSMPFSMQANPGQKSNDLDPFAQVNPPVKRQRSQSMSAMSSSAEDSQRSSFLERNRKAAMKCRQKKKNYLIGLEQQVEYLAKENKRLQEELALLQGMASMQ